MEPEETAPSKGKKFLKITLWVLGTLAVLIGTAYVLTALKNARQEADQALRNAAQTLEQPPEPRAPLTEAEKMELLKNMSMSQNPATTTKTLQKATVNATVVSEKLKILNSLATQSKLSSTSSTLSAEEKLKLLESMKSN